MYLVSFTVFVSVSGCLHPILKIDSISQASVILKM